jgi:hypothetical protein
MDLNLSRDPYDSYRIFQSQIIEQYEYMVKPQGFTVIDGTSGIEEQQKLVRERVKDILWHHYHEYHHYQQLQLERQKVMMMPKLTKRRSFSEMKQNATMYVWRDYKK